MRVSKTKMTNLKAKQHEGFKDEPLAKYDNARDIMQYLLCHALVKGYKAIPQLLVQGSVF